MAVYRLYFIDALDHIRDAVEVQGVDDGGAIRAAEELADGRRMELWRGARKVMIFMETTGGVSAAECRRRADALVELARLIPERAEAYRKVEMQWRKLEAEARGAKARRVGVHRGRAAERAPAMDPFGLGRNPGSGHFE